MRPWSRWLLKELRAHEFLEGLISLGHVIHDFLATRTTARTSGELASADLLPTVYRRNPDLASMVALGANSTSHCVQPS